MGIFDAFVKMVMVVGVEDARGAEWLEGLRAVGDTMEP